MAITKPDANGITFTPAGTGGVQRILEGKLRESVSVGDYGASPSASGVVNRAAFVAAFTASSVVYVPAGAYAISGATLVIPDGTRFYGAGKYATVINFTTATDTDCFQIGWYTAMEEMTVNALFAGAGSFGTLRLQSLTNAEIPANVGGNDWTSPVIGGLSYKNILRNLVLSGGQNYNIYGANLAYVTIENVRAVLSHGPSGNCYIWGTGGANMPASTTVKIIGGEYTASFAGPGITLKNTAQTLLQGAVAEGNYGRGILIDSGLEIKLQSCYVENNFALGAGVGDGDITVLNSTRIHISDSYILGNHSSNAVAASGNTACSMKSTGYYVLGGATHSLALDAGWFFSASAFGVYDSGTQAGGRWVRYVDGTAVFTKTVAWTGDITAAAGGIFIDPAGVTDTDFPSIFMSDGALGYHMQASLHIMSDGANFIWPLSGGSSRTNNAVRYRFASPTSKTGITVDVQITLTGKWK